MDKVTKKIGGVLHNASSARLNRKNEVNSDIGSTAPTRLAYLDILKGIGIILVVMGHIYRNTIFYSFVYSFHMPLFFFAAGCVYKCRSVLVDLKRRAQTIVIPYFSFGLLTLLYWQLLERRFRESSMSFGGAVIGLLSGQYDYLDFNVHLWFLPCFFITVVFYNVLVNVIGREDRAFGKKITGVICLAMSMVYIVLALLGLSLPGLPWGIDRVFKYIGFFAAGVCLAERRVGGKSAAMPVLLEAVSDHKTVSMIIATVLTVCNFALSYFGFTNGVFWFITASIGIAGVLVIAMAVKSRVLQYLGRITLVVLCVHGPVYRIVCKLFSMPLRMDTEVLRSNIILAGAVAAVTLVISCIVYEIVNRFLPWMIGKK